MSHTVVAAVNKDEAEGLVGLVVLLLGGGKYLYLCAAITCAFVAWKLSESGAKGDAGTYWGAAAIFFFLLFVGGLSV